MHGKPVQLNGTLLSPVDYLHSSARYYLYGEQGIYTVTNVRKLDDIDLTKRLPDKNAESSGSAAKASKRGSARKVKRNE